MRNDQSHKIYRRLILFGLVSLAIIVTSYLSIVYWGFPIFTQSASGIKNWDLFGAFTSLISLSLLAGGFTFALAEYIDTEKAKQAEKAKLSYEIYKAIFDKLTAPEQEAARRWILSNILIKKDNEDVAAWYKTTNDKIMSGGTGSVTDLPEGQDAVKLTLNCFDYIGFIASHYWEIEKDSLDWISAPIAKVWRRLGPYVLYVRTLRNTTDYYLSAEYIGDLCVEWRKSKGMPDEEIAKNTP
jgi:hypothetical protein